MQLQAKGKQGKGVTPGKQNLDAQETSPQCKHATERCLRGTLARVEGRFHFFSGAPGELVWSLVLELRLRLHATIKRLHAHPTQTQKPTL